MAQPALNDPHQDKDGPEFPERIFMALSTDMLKSIEDYRFANRFKSQSAAVRKLMELGLRTVGWEAQKKKP